MASADLTDANLSGAQMFGLVTSSGMETSRREAPIMVRANLSGARVVSRLGHADLTGANLSGAKMSADMKNQSMGLMRAEFPGANLTGADLHQADFIGANLAGAQLTGANATGTNFEAAEIKNAIGLDSVKGLDRTGSR